MPTKINEYATKELRKIYQQAYSLGWTDGTYREWRGAVLHRINVVLETNYVNMPDQRIWLIIEMLKTYSPSKIKEILML